jgi:hypothetical protein
MRLALILTVICKTVAASDAVENIRPLTEAGIYESDGRKFERGLYPGGSNALPVKHGKSGELLAASITPKNGMIKAAVIGHSNTVKYFEGLNALVVAEAKKGTINASFKIANRAVPGKMCSNWVHDAREGKLDIPEDAQVLFMLTSYHASSLQSTKQKFPEVVDKSLAERVKLLKAGMKEILIAAVLKAPNLKIAYIGSDTWRGYTKCEPQVFEEAFAVKSLIEDQINGDQDLAFEGVNRKVPWLAWGGYIWEPAPSRDRFIKDGVHPSAAGIDFAAGRWLKALQDSSAARGWFSITKK